MALRTLRGIYAALSILDTPSLQMLIQCLIIKIGFYVTHRNLGYHIQMKAVRLQVIYEVDTDYTDTQLL